MSHSTRTSPCSVSPASPACSRHEARILALLLWALASSPAPLPSEETRGPRSPGAPPQRVFEEHGARISAVKLSPDGSLLATASDDKTVKLQGVASGREIATLRGHEGRVLCLEFSRDGRWLASGGEDKVVKLWPIPGDQAVPLARHEGKVRGMCSSRDGSLLATAGADGAVRLWKPGEGTEILELQVPADPLRCVALSSDGRRLAAGGESGIVWIWNLPSSAPPPPAKPADKAPAEIVKAGDPWRYLKGNAAPPAQWKDKAFDDSSWTEGKSGFGYSSNEGELKSVATRLDDMKGSYLTLYIRARLQIPDPRQVEKLVLRVLIDDGFVAYINGQEVGRDQMQGASPEFSSQAAAAVEPHSVELDLMPHLPKLVPGENVIAIEGHNSGKESTDFILTPVLLAALQVVKPEKEAPPESGPARLEGLGGPVLAVAWSPDGTSLAAAIEGRAARVWKLGEALNVASEKILDQGGPARAIGFVSGGLLAAGGEDGSVRIWNVTERKIEKTLEGHGRPVLALSAAEDGRLISGGEDGAVRLWDCGSGKEVRKLAGHEGAVKAVAFSLDSSTIISGGADKTVRIWDAVRGDELRKLTHADEVEAVAAGGGEKWCHAASGSEAYEWRRSSGEALRTFKGAWGKVRCVTFSPDGRVIAAGSDDKVVRFWDREAGKELRAIQPHETVIYALAFDPPGTLLATGGLDRTVKIWKVEGGSLLEKLEGHGDGVFALAFSADGKLLYAGGSDRKIHEWDVIQGKEAGVLEGHSAWICAVALLPDGRLGSMGHDGEWIVWDGTTSKPADRRTAGRFILGFDISADGKLLAVTGLSGKAFLLDRESLPRRD